MGDAADDVYKAAIAQDDFDAFVDALITDGRIVECEACATCGCEKCDGYGWFDADGNPVDPVDFL